MRQMRCNNTIKLDGCRAAFGRMTNGGGQGPCRFKLAARIDALLSLFLFFFEGPLALSTFAMISNVPREEPFLRGVGQKTECPRG
jgi:hypothetical protein